MRDPPPTTDHPTGGSWVVRSFRERFVPAERIGRQLAGISLFGAFGSGMYYASSALYFTTVVGLRAGQVGTGLSAGAAVGLLGAVPIGMLADRLRTGHVYIGLQLVRGVVFTALCLVDSFWPYVICCVFAGLTEAALNPVLQAIVGAVVPDADRVDTLAKVRAMRSVGFGLGALAATAAIALGSRAAFLVLIAGNAASYFGIAARLAHIGIGRVAVVADRAKVPRRFVPDGRYTLTGLFAGVLSVHLTLLVVAVPLWFVRYTTMPPAVVGILVFVNTALAALLQARLARSSTSVRGAVRAALYAGLALAGFGIASQLAHRPLGTVPATALAFAAVILLTFAGLWQSASSWSLSYELADPRHRTAYLSTFQLGQTLQQALAPWAITVLLFPAPGGWFLFGVITVAAGLLIRFTARPRRPTV